MIKNYHMHTWRCKHATGSDEDYVKAAIANNFKLIGFSDHCPWNNAQSLSFDRMPVNQLPEYISSIRRLQQVYKDIIQIQVGLECEYFRDRLDWLKEVEETYRLDYLLLGIHVDSSDEGHKYFFHCTVDDVKRYTELAVEGMLSEMFKYLCHPDVFMYSIQEVNSTILDAFEEICKCAEYTSPPLEYNLRGVGRGYTTDTFWQVASKYNIKAIMGLDAHNPIEFYNTEKIRKAEKKLRNLGIEVISW